MPNQQLERIAVKRKAIATFTLPEMPRMPGWVVRQFHLESWENELEQWRRNAQEALRDALKAIQSE